MVAERVRIDWGSTSRTNGQVTDLVAGGDAQVILLDLLSSQAWKQRLISRLEFGSGQHVRINHEYQCEIGRGQSRHLDSLHTPKARVWLPLTTRQKRPLLNFDVVGPDGSPAHLLPRSEIAGRQGAYLGWLGEQTRIPETVAEQVSSDLLDAICLFSPHVFDSYRDQHRTHWAAVVDYLRAGLEMPLSDRDVWHWLQRTDRAGDILAWALDEPADYVCSSSECMLLALPLLEDKPSSPDEIRSIVDSYCDLVEALALRFVADGESSALEFLVVLAEYGRRWEMIVDVEIPIGRPTTITMADDHRLSLDRSCRSCQTLSLGDALSVHVEAASLDPAVFFSRELEIVDLHGNPIGIGPVSETDRSSGPLEQLESNSEVLSLYTSAERPAWARLTVGLKPSAEIRAPVRVALGLTLIASVAAAIVEGNGNLADKLAVLVVPTSFAAAFVVVRERTTLATRVLRRDNVALGLAVVTMWLIAIARLLHAGSVL